VSAELVVDATRVGWLTLSFMMLLSRVLFQARGPVAMRAFLDGWQSGRVKRLWGAAALGYAAFLVAAAASVRGGGLGAADLAFLAALVLTLVADGTLNVIPPGFETFKSRLQDEWVARRRGTGKEGDRHLFGTVNALLALGAAATAAAVAVYRPIAGGTVALAAALAGVLTVALVAASSLERRR
jgi:hypothetical protein